MAKNLKLAVTIENSEVIEVSHASKVISDSSLKVKNMAILSPTKLLLFFESEDDVEYALKENSVL